MLSVAADPGDLWLWYGQADGRHPDPQSEYQGPTMDWPTAIALVAAIIAVMAIVTTWIATRTQKP